MTNHLYHLAEGGAEHGNLPLSGQISPLLPFTYDMVWSALCFIVILIGFWKFVLPKAREVLVEREDRIKGGIQRAEAAQAEAKAALEKYNAQLAEARAEAAQIREDARTKGKQIIEDMKTQATEESNRIIESGEKQLMAQREQVITELRREMGQNSINLAERLLGEQLGDNVKRSGTIDAFLSDLDTVAPAGK
ncbi:F0F1 ATP synthase subunit B [Corynebacterium pygosceleis]|uniref:ATP synthase subunit b n=1 Tax=Corynebacterium pygosceleis TaxID=2800406 RepID=A0A9Q4GJY5_9CORY|nr:F0F1 ATP synthase subunit B [Corynebacterium pygosceleis]MCK7637918.1 F0F1 ATP synthase subunit B [Corynebacterium pygosceleis]MCK7675633.1 F0F1 ATP synthase subunit B [Corynebacterium pygosceleis]MCL0120973.1 F0F1 ATP synthase subunit B [Corynebacterium pygosceleis]MCX7444543.1 F0F1 ATP synthase subunit B [Corynebacterium pygosceleis]MCX7468634.1 F0F1 ATP synthase subunit B [Corynebacterium pygosceleis]